MFPRILAADFPKPDWLSPGCVNLLSRMICADPARRVSVEGVLRHPWFRTGMHACPALLPLKLALPSYAPVT